MFEIIYLLIGLIILYNLIIWFRINSKINPAIKINRFDGFNLKLLNISKTVNNNNVIMLFIAYIFFALTKIVSFPLYVDILILFIYLCVLTIQSLDFYTLKNDLEI